MNRILLTSVLISLLAGWSVAQAFGFCFNFGGGSNSRADFYNRPPPAVGFGPDVYNYPSSPVYAVPLYRPYYPAQRASGYYGDRIARPIEQRQRIISRP